jgi:hypothetical protein
VVEAFRMFEDKQILQWFVRVFEETGPTFEKTILGSKSIDTIEPENIESILSTNFSGKAFCAETSRHCLTHSDRLQPWCSPASFRTSSGRRNLHTRFRTMEALS